ncbi:outer membrane protein assembly factor BamD [Desulfobacter hydrogenophilus]|uniref:Outer membrane protein assembly factor BamD n=1 Tax=Desulfobacter hydrogenophilus TaxID=2291 RepID=A0A328FG58_9BACT|nr:outer membrane protein assembly factor BamD [Desulfobacter hydrogenophilus]NDY70721.1 outer membrane protein assembly factor BamD [Desulfobacter hydrogenophilus]QBH12666.1 outer membrane protein assembly factor BamD [Desulfobacter hydrogenophilus]RAM03369.1 outer membrane protein assembly factor BamD [Desulfobacter hydrogenophilus]
MKKFLIAGMVFLFLSGCALFEENHQMNKNAQQLAAEGAASFMNEDYEDAVKAYTDLKDWYPFSKYAILAELKIADAHFHLEEYPEAIAAYENFEKLHPKNEAVPYIINQIAMCWFNQINTIDRDATPAKKAMAEFKRLIRLFPENEYSQDALAHIDACIDNIVSHELYVADFYNKTKKYEAALKRYQYIVENYAGTDQSQIALENIPKMSEHIKAVESDNEEK